MTPSAQKILIADDDGAIRLVLAQAFTRLGYQVRATGNAATLLKWVSDGDGDLVITDVVMPDENVFVVLPKIRKARPKLPVLVMSAQSTLTTAVKAAELGAFDYLAKPFDLDDMTAAAAKALARPATREGAKAHARAQRDDRLPLIGRSPSMQEVYRTIARLVGTDLTVLIIGRSEAGKELHGARAARPGATARRPVRGGQPCGAAKGPRRQRDLRWGRRRQAHGGRWRGPVPRRNRRYAAGFPDAPAKGLR